MLADAAYPLAVTIATLFAISSAHSNGDWFYAEANLTIPLLLGVSVLIVLACASFAVGILIPESIVIAEIEGIVVPP